MISWTRTLNCPFTKRFSTLIHESDWPDTEEVSLCLVRCCGTHYHWLSVMYHWYWLSSEHNWRLFCFPEPTGHHHSASVTVSAVSLFARTQIYLLTYYLRVLGHRQLFIFFHLTCLDLNVMNLALHCLFSQYSNTRILSVKLTIIFNFLTYYSTYGLWKNNNEVYCRWQGVRWAMRLASENSWAWRVWSMWAGDCNDLSCAHLNRECHFHVKSAKMIGGFWLVLLTEQEVLHYYAPNMVYCCLVAGHL